MRVHFCGVRGSTPAPGRAFARHGGHTACVAVSHDAGEPSTLVLDGGTGLRRLTESLAGGPFRGTILLSHLHWDHTQGLPFFAAAAHPESATRVLVPTDGHTDPVAMLRPMIGPPFFPLAPDELRGDWTFERLEAGTHNLEGFAVTALEIPHIGRTFGFRVASADATLAYLTDHGCGMSEGEDAVLALAENADLVIHDAQHTAAEFPDKAFLGHSTAEYAAELATRAGAKRLALFHHDFDRTDDQIDAIVASVQTSDLDVFAAAEGLAIDL